VGKLNFITFDPPWKNPLLPLPLEKILPTSDSEPPRVGNGKKRSDVSKMSRYCDVNISTPANCRDRSRHRAHNKQSQWGGLVLAKMNTANTCCTGCFQVYSRTC